MTAAPEPMLHVRRPPARPVGAVLLLPGGRAESDEPARAWQLSNIRVRLLARAVRRWAAPRRVLVATVRYRVRGWNGSGSVPVADARWALGQIRARYGDLPVCLVGHSMGGRTAFRVADAESVVGVLGLAPWLPIAEPVRPLPGRRVLVVHGDADRWTSPTHSQAYVADLKSAGTQGAEWAGIPAAGHFMLRRPGTWRRHVLDFVAACLRLEPESAR